MQKNESRPRPYALHKKINSKWIIELNVKCKTIVKLLDNNIGENLDDLDYGFNFIDTTPKAQSMK